MSKYKPVINKYAKLPAEFYTFILKDLKIKTIRNIQILIGDKLTGRITPNVDEYIEERLNYSVDCISIEYSRACEELNEYDNINIINTFNVDGENPYTISLMSSESDKYHEYVMIEKQTDKYNLYTRLSLIEPRYLNKFGENSILTEKDKDIIVQYFKDNWRSITSKDNNIPDYTKLKISTNEIGGRYWFINHVDLSLNRFEGIYDSICSRDNTFIITIPCASDYIKIYKKTDKGIKVTRLSIFEPRIVNSFTNDLMLSNNDIDSIIWLLERRTKTYDVSGISLFTGWHYVPYYYNHDTMYKKLNRENIHYYIKMPDYNKLKEK